MKVLFDVAVLVAHARADHSGHDCARRAVTVATAHAEAIIAPDAVLLAVIRITTRSGAFAQPSSLQSAFAYITFLRSHPAFVAVSASAETLVRQQSLLRHVGRSPNEIVDAYIAALAIELGATVLSPDRGFARFPGVAWTDPADPLAVEALGP